MNEFDCRLLGYPQHRDSNPTFRVKRIEYPESGDLCYLYGVNDTYRVVMRYCQDGCTTSVILGSIVEYEECGVNIGLFVGIL